LTVLSSGTTVSTDAIFMAVTSLPAVSPALSAGLGGKILRIFLLIGIF
jgi:hypothetical protein